FGQAVDIRGSEVLVGAPGRVTHDWPSTTTSELFVFDAGNPTAEPLTVSHEHAYGTPKLGTAVAFANGSVLAGAPGYSGVDPGDPSQNVYGVVYLFPYNHTPVAEEFAFQMVPGIAGITRPLFGFDPYEGSAVEFSFYDEDGETWVDAASIEFTPMTVAGENKGIATDNAGSVTFDPATQMFTFVPAVNFYGKAWFQYKVTDADEADSNTATVTLLVAAPGDASLDEQVNDDDARILAANWYQSNATWEMGDFNGDRTVNALDAAIMSANWGYVHGDPPPRIPGDATGDAKVDLADAIRLSANWGATDATWEMGDFDGDGVVDAIDAAILAANWGYGTAEGTAYDVSGEPAPAMTVCNVAVAHSAFAGSQFPILTAYHNDKQLQPLPMYDGIDRVLITFDQVVSSSEGELLDYLTITDERGAGTTHHPTSVSLSADGMTATWTFATTFRHGEWVLDLSDRVTSYDPYLDEHVALDGEWNGPDYLGDASSTSCFFYYLKTSGDGAAGGDFTFAFSLLLPGDANRDGRVDELDLQTVAANVYAGISSGATWEDGDFDGDGDVDDDDLYALASNWRAAQWREKSGGVTYANDAPKVAGVAVANSAVSGSTIVVPGRAGDDVQLHPLPVLDGMNQIIITFDRPISSSAVELAGYLTLTDGYGWGTEYAPTIASISPDGKTVTWDFASTWQFGEWRLSLSDGVTANGLALDGEWHGPGHIGDTAGTSEFSLVGTSGDGAPGGDFNFSFSLLLPGDVNLDGKVNSADFQVIGAHFGQSGVTWLEGDLNGDGIVNGDDFDICDDNLFAMSWPRGMQVAKVEVANSGVAGSTVFVPTMAGSDVQLRPLPIQPFMYNSGLGGGLQNVLGGIDQIVLTFDREIGSSTGDLLGYLTLTELETETDYSPTSVAVSPDGKTVTWTFAQEFQWNRWTLNLSDEIVSTDGLPLDGEWNGPKYRGDTSGTNDLLGNNLHGDGVLGGDFEFAFSLLITGDCNMNGVVNTVDYAMFSQGWMTSSGATWQLGDFDFDGDVDLGDLDLLGTNWFNPQTWYEPTTVTAVEVANSSLPGSAIAIPTAVGTHSQLLPLAAFDGVDQVVLTFSKPVIASVWDLTLANQRGAGTVYSPASVSTSPDGRTVTWTFATEFKFGEWVLNLSDSLTDVEGVALDGEWSGPGYRGSVSGASSFNNGGTSGDGRPGGDFVFALSLLLPGDVNMDGAVDNDDLIVISSHWGQSGMTWEEGDLNGDGTINAFDAAIVAAQFGREVWPTALMVAGVSVANSTISGSEVAVPTADPWTPSAQVRPLPVYDGVDQVILTFNKPVTSSTGQLLDYLTLTDECGLGTEYSPTNVSVSVD
ncbi:MAG: hypothetical protein GX621_02985, partial [Pirellulaceae bacterium]|nr:hypothetical protein [Pirellulaceae bacterium]